MTIPPEMVTASRDTEPLFDQLGTMLKMCHVTTGHPGLFGSIAVHRMYLEGVQNTKAMRKRGGATAEVNQAKTTRLSNIVKNKVCLYMRQLYWMHSVIPTIIKLPPAASFEAMQSTKVEDDERPVLTAALCQAADDFVFPATHPLHDPIKATASILRQVLNKMALAGHPGAPRSTASMLASCPFRELLAEADKNVKERYK